MQQSKQNKKAGMSSSLLFRFEHKNWGVYLFINQFN
jgi:hypothetical protein